MASAMVGLPRFLPFAADSRVAGLVMGQDRINAAYVMIVPSNPIALRNCNGAVHSTIPAAGRFPRAWRRRGRRGKIRNAPSPCQRRRNDNAASALISGFLGDHYWAMYSTSKFTIRLTSLIAHKVKYFHFLKILKPHPATFAPVAGLPVAAERAAIAVWLPIPTKPPLCSDMIAPPGSEMISPPGARALLALIVVILYVSCVKLFTSVFAAGFHPSDRRDEHCERGGPGWRRHRLDFQ